MANKPQFPHGYAPAASVSGPGQAPQAYMGINDEDTNAYIDIAVPYNGLAKEVGNAFFCNISF